jgi:hypothetical protein
MTSIFSKCLGSATTPNREAQSSEGAVVSLQTYLPVKQIKMPYRDEHVYGSIQTDEMLSTLITEAAKTAEAARAQDAVDDQHKAWEQYDGAGLEPLLVSDKALGASPVALLDARFLIALAKGGGILRRRQDLPSAAFIRLAELKQMPNALRVCCISYPWLQPDHPDPRATSLRLIANLLERVIAFSGGTFAVFLDYSSLFQSPRSDAQQSLFKTALSRLSDIYSHPETYIFKVTRLPEGYPAGFVFPEGKEANQADYYDRGWCFCESAMGSLIKSSNKVFDLANYTGSVYKNFGHCMHECMAGRRPPLSPAAFPALLETKAFTNKKGDIEAVAALYRRAFERRFATAQKLIYYGLRWTGEDVQALCCTLAEAKALPLEGIDFKFNKIDDAGAAALAAFLRAGGAPKMKVIDLRGNPTVSPAAVQALEEAREGLIVGAGPVPYSSFDA